MININTKNHLKRLFYSFKKTDDYQKISKSDILFICHDNHRADLIDGKFFSKYIDSICVLFVEEFGYSVSHLARPYSYRKKSNYFFDVYTFNISYEFCRVFDKIFGTTLLDRLYRKILTIVDPKIVFGILVDSRFIKIMHECDVKYIEVMHGLGVCNTNEVYYKNMSISERPDFIVSFDKVTTKTYSKIYGQSKVLTISNPWIYFLDKNYRYNDVNFFKRIPDANINIIYSCQWGFDKKIEKSFEVEYKNGVLPNEIENLIADNKISTNWFIRLHPVQLHDPRYKSHVKFVEELENTYSNVFSRISSEIPLPLLLKNMDVHITAESSVVYEAAKYHIPSLTLSKRVIKDNMFKDIQQQGLLTIGEYDINCIKNFISKNIDSKNKKSNDKFDKPNLKFIKKLLSNENSSYK